MGQVAVLEAEAVASLLCETGLASRRRRMGHAG